MQSIRQLAARGLSVMSSILSSNAVAQDQAKALKEESVKAEDPGVKQAQKEAVARTYQNVLTGRLRSKERRLGANRHLPKDEQEIIKAAAQAKRDRRAKRANGYSAS